MGNLLHDLFPDAPMWVPWLAFWLMVIMFLFLLACLVANPVDAWRNRQVAREDREARGTYVGITDTGSLTAVKVATGVPVSHRKED
jgi:hypothetical protein